MTKSRIFIFACASFAAGVFLASWLQVGLFWSMGLTALSASVFALGYQAGARKVFLPACFLFFVGLGAFRLQASFSENRYAPVFESKQEMEGLIVEDPDIRPDRQLLTFQPDGFNQRALVTASRAQDYFYGDRVVVEGKFKEPKSYEDFDYRKYLERYEIYSVVSYPKILVLKTGEGNLAKLWLLKLKQAFVKNLSAKFEEPYSSLLLGILIGAKKTLSAELTANFQATGLSHIVAVSGYNITILASFLGFTAYFFGRKASFWFSLLAIFGFAVIAGWSASVVRAAVMGSVLLLGLKVGRPYAAGPGIALAAAVMVALNPRVLFWDVGFQLSFLATLGIVYGLPLLEKMSGLESDALGFRAAALSSLAAIVATLPLSLMQFGQLPVYALLANLLVLPAVPYVMLLGFLATLPFLGPGFAFVSKFLLAYIVWAVGLIAHWPGAVFKISLGPLAVFAAYGLVLGLYFLLLRKFKPG